MARQLAAEHPVLERRANSHLPLRAGALNAGRGGSVPRTEAVLTTLARAGALLALAALAPSPGRASDGFRCDGGLVGVGDLAVDLVGKCGPPNLRERWTETRDALAVDVKAGLAEAQRVTTEVEQWTYDFGTNRFLQLVTIHNGQIVRVDQGGYGHGLPPGGAPGRPRVSDCDPSWLRQGDTKADALGRCGPPAERYAWQASRTTPVVLTGSTLVAETSVVRAERWVYNLGPNRFLRIVRFEDGRVTRVDTGGYGYRE